jgi:hypothetical protein
MELVANIWPIVDQETGIVHRFLIRAYALSATDEEISAVLTTLARSDYRTAPPVKIPDRYKLTSEHGTISGAIPISGFHEELNNIVEEALGELEQSFAKLHNYGVNSSGNPRPAKSLKFPDNPYFVTTSLLESPSGELIVQLSPML